jgi:hypothetical protein
MIYATIAFIQQKIVIIFPRFILIYSGGKDLQILDIKTSIQSINLFY